MKAFRQNTLGTPTDSYFTHVTFALLCFFFTAALTPLAGDGEESAPHPFAQSLNDLVAQYTFFTDHVMTDQKNAPLRQQVSLLCSTLSLTALASTAAEEGKVRTDELVGALSRTVKTVIKTANIDPSCAQAVRQHEQLQQFIDGSMTNLSADAEQEIPLFVYQAIRVEKTGKALLHDVIGAIEQYSEASIGRLLEQFRTDVTEVIAESSLTRSPEDSENLNKAIHQTEVERRIYMQRSEMCSIASHTCAEVLETLKKSDHQLSLDITRIVSMTHELLSAMKLTYRALAKDIGVITIDKKQELVHHLSAIIGEFPDLDGYTRNAQRFSYVKKCQDQADPVMREMVIENFLKKSRDSEAFLEQFFTVYEYKTEQDLANLARNLEDHIGALLRSQCWNVRPAK